MPKPDPARLDPAFYPMTFPVETRFQDLDPLGHINNVAMGAIFETGRVKFNHANGTFAVRRVADHRWLIASVAINYIAEGSFPEAVEVGHAITRIGRSSWEIASAAFQEGRCIATCDCVLVATDSNGAVPLSEEFVALLEKVRI